MTTLGAPAGLDDTTLTFDAPYSSTADYPIPMTVDSEKFELIGGKGSRVVSVRRGSNGSTQASHAIGATVMAGWGGGGSISATGGDGTSVTGVTALNLAGSVTDQGGGAAGLGTFTWLQPVDPTQAPTNATPTDGQTWCDTSHAADGYFVVQVWLDAASGWTSVVAVESTALVSSVDLNTLRVVVNNDGRVIVAVPTADPSVAGALYTNGVPSAGVPRALMVSGG